MPEIKEEEIYHIGAVHGVHVEVGYRRFRRDVIKRLLQQNKSFRKGWMEKWLEGISSFEFGAKMDNPLSILEGKCKFGYAPPHRDYLYKERKARGDFTS